MSLSLSLCLFKKEKRKEKREGKVPSSLLEISIDILSVSVAITYSVVEKVGGGGEWELHQSEGLLKVNRPV